MHAVSIQIYSLTWMIDEANRVKTKNIQLNKKGKDGTNFQAAKYITRQVFLENEIIKYYIS